MTGLAFGWAVSAAVLLVIAALLGGVIGRGPTGILIDTRGRYSLTQLQLTLWTLVVVSMLSGLVWGRLTGGFPTDAFGFNIPGELLAVLGISIGSAASSTVVKAYKDTVTPRSIAASDSLIDSPHFAQIFLEEEGPMADKVVDITKFQNFWFTILLVFGYVALVIATIHKVKSIGDFVLPGFSQTFVLLLGISHAGYVAGKIPTSSQPAAGLAFNQLADYRADPSNVPSVAAPRRAPRH